jgi:hypothetical protein
MREIRNILFISAENYKNNCRLLTDLSFTMDTRTPVACTDCYRSGLSFSTRYGSCLFFVCSLGVPLSVNDPARSMYLCYIVWKDSHYFLMPDAGCPGPHWLVCPLFCVCPVCLLSYSNNNTARNLPFFFSLAFTFPH